MVLVFMLLYCSLGSCNKAKETKHNWGRQMEAKLDVFTHMPATAISTKQSICSLRNNRVHRVLSHNGYNIIFMAGFILSESEACVLTPSVTSNSLRLWSTFTIRIKSSPKSRAILTSQMKMLLLRLFFHSSGDEMRSQLFQLFNSKWLLR